MFSQRNTILILLVLAAVLAVAKAEDALTLSTADRVLLLRNGQVLRGRISQAADIYTISIGTDEIRVKARDVDLVCQNLEEVFQRKRGMLHDDDVARRLDLAAWCVRFKLFDQARAELADLRKIEPRNPRIAFLERQLELSLKEPEASTAAPSTAEPPPSSEALNRLTASLPDGTVGTFVTTIQPLLLNNCATGGCHASSNAGKFKLIRMPAGRVQSRRLTQRNLHSVMQMVDIENPDASPLLLTLTEEHGQADRRAINPQQYRQLAEWVQQAAGATDPQRPSTVNVDDGFLSQRFDSRRGVARSAETHPTSEAAPVPRKAKRPASDRNSDLPDAESDLPLRNRQPRGFAPVDPFDPEIFNRTFFPPEADEPF